MKIRYMELAEPLREGGLEKAAADMATYLGEKGVEVFRGPGGVDAFGPVDLVHFHGLWSPAHWSAARWCRRNQIPVIVSPHGMLEPWAFRHRRWKKWPYFYLVERKRLAGANVLLATAGAEAANILDHVPGARVETISLGIEPDVGPDYESARKQTGWGDDERVLLYLSRIHPKKGLLELIHALREIGSDGNLPSMRLVVVGDGPAEYVAKCRNAAESLRNLMPVDWFSPQWGGGKWKFLQAADLFCLPTYSENFGIVMLEAGIVGTPVFTTTGTPWKNIEEAGFGWVTDPVPSSYPDVLRQFLRVPNGELQARRQPFADWTREHYAWPRLVQQYVDLYRMVINQGS